MQLNFVCRASKARKNGLSPIELSIIISNKRKVITLDRKINPTHWNPKSQTVKNNKEINTYLQSITQKLYTLQTELIQHNIPVTIENILDAYKHGVNPSITILNLYEQHNNQYKLQYEQNQTSYTTYLKYQKGKEYLQKYIQQTTSKQDMDITKITTSFIDNHYTFLLQYMAHNSAIKIMKRLKKIIQLAIDEGYIQTNPFKFKLQEEKVLHNPLSITQIEKIRNYLISRLGGLSRLRNVGYCFLFQAFTGLAYVDMKNLSRENIHDDMIIIKRQKTNVTSIIPLLPQAKEILEMYDYKLPVLSNQKYNAYLKEIQDLCEIPQTLHSHLARHTFATLLINNNVPLPVISKALGHSNTRITESTYAQIQNKTIYQEIMKLKDVI